jgi:superfamily II DNA/RNA helicase
MNKQTQSGAYRASGPSNSFGPKRGSSASSANRGSRGGSQSSSFNRPQRSGYGSSGSSFGRGGSSSLRGGRSFGGKPKGGPKRTLINESLFVNKAKYEDVEVYVPKHTFNDFNLDAKLVANIAHKGYVTASPIQDQAIPEVLTGRDIIGIANTGTGKTAAFLLPLIQKLVENPKQKVMVLTPTRELAQQIEAELRAFVFGMKLFSVCAVGGLPIRRQMTELERGVSFVIGTPGRVKDLIERGKIKMEQFKYIVLDEADRMLDMGFIDDMRTILKEMKEDKQGLFFSATMPPAIKTLCSQFLNDPVHISVKTRDTASSIDQDVVRIRHKGERVEVLHNLLSKEDFSKVLIFREMKRQVDELGDELRKRGFSVMGLHGDMQNRQRSNAVKALAKGDIQILIATDVAARGIDIPDITHVINYDVPRDYETYIHRVGRTGRGNAKGQALTFI